MLTFTGRCWLPRVKLVLIDIPRWCVLESLIAGRGVLVHHLLQLILEHLKLLEEIVKLLSFELKLVPQKALKLHGLGCLFFVDIHGKLDLFL